MKHLITLSLLVCSCIIWGQDPIKIEERRETFSVGMQNALVSNIPMGKEDLVEKVVKDEVKKFKGKLSGKEEFFIEQATKSSIADKPIDVYVKIIKIAGGKMELAWAINLGGTYLNKAEHPDMYRKAEERVYAVVKRISTEAVDLEVKEEEAKLKDLEKELDKLVKDKEKQEKDIQKNEEDIKEFKNEIKLNEASQQGKKAEIKTLHEQENSDADALKEKNKELDKMMKEKEKFEKKIKTAESNIVKAKDNISLNLKSQETKKGEIEAQKKYIKEEVKVKYSMIK